MDKKIFENKLLNRIYLENIIIISKKLHDWKISQDRDFQSLLFENANFTLGSKLSNYNEGLQKVITDIETSLMRHLLTLIYEYGDENLNMLTPREKAEFAELKNNISIDNTLKSYDQNNLMKILRQTMAHNTDSIAEPNWTTDFFSNTIVSKPLKKNQSAKMRLSTDDTHSLIISYFKKTYNDTPELAPINRELLFEKLENNSLSIIDIKNIFDSENRLDIHQLKALQNLTTSLKKDFINCTSSDLLEKLIFHITLIAYPHKNNAHNNFFLNSYNLGFINSLRTNPTAQEYKENNNFRNIDDTPELGKFLGMQTYKNIEHGLIINALFYLFSISPPNELEELFKESKLYNFNPTKLRNSIIHGRYYYNYNNGYEFYDGPDNNNLEHIGSAKSKDLLALLKHVFHRQIEQLEKQIDDMTK